MLASEAIKKVRLELCMSQAELSRALEITSASISLYERGMRKPSFGTIRKILALAKKNNIELKLEDIRS